MARAVLERKLMLARDGEVQFAVAAESDDAEIRRLLLENPIQGRISVALEREPNYFADAQLSGETKQTIIARENGKIVCVGNCAVRERFVNGTVRRVGYLGGLRLDAQRAGRFDIVRRGYNFFRELQACAPGDFYFTSVAADNERARRILERGLPGMPRYEFICEFVTVLLSTTHGSIVNRDSGLGPRALNEIVEHVNSHNQKYQFAPKWHGEDPVMLGGFGLRHCNFHFIGKRDESFGCAAIWDQRAFKQTVIRGYDRMLDLLRPAHNLFTRLSGRPKLPPSGAILANAYVSHLAADDPAMLLQLIANLRCVAGQSELELLTMGFAADDPRLAAITANFPHYQYRTRLYTVHWPGLGHAADELDGRALAPEVALL
ncbi:MAG TPA: hypothetical protein VFB72_10000 [Verrucomicrobiae bacterium]|nr:hypothetical protein [Verrucomicrobiae bacterium]